MAEFFSFLKVFLICGTVFFIAFVVLLALPQSRLRQVGLEMSKYALAGLLVLMVPLPIDVLPDFVPPFTWLDDCGYAAGAWWAIRSALENRQQRKVLEEAELEQLRSKTEKQS